MLDDLNRDLVALPAPSWFPLVLLFLPGLLLLGLLVARLAVRGRLMAWALAPAAALSIWLVLLQAGSLVVHRFYPVAAVAVVLPGCVGYALSWRSRGRLTIPPNRGVIALGAAVLGVFVFGIPLFLFYEAWDRDGFGGHYAIVAQILNNVLPPRELTFTDNPLHYHLAIDYMAAFWIAATRLPVDRVFDAVSMVQWAYLAVMVAAVARAVFRVRRPWMAAVVGCLAGGIPWATGLNSDLRPKYRDLGLSQDIMTLGPLPGVAQQVLQPPWLVGTPMVFALVVLLARGAWDGRGIRGAATIGLGALFVVALAMSQTAFLAVVIAATCVWAAWRSLGPAWRSARTLVGTGQLPAAPGFDGVVLRQLGAVVLGALIATALGAGLVQATASTDILASSPFRLTDMGLSAQYSTHDIPATRRWSAFVLATTYAFLVPLAVVALFRRRRSLISGASILWVGAAVGIVLMNLVQHRYSWDMLKFGAVAVFFLAPMAAAAIDDIWGDGRSRRRVGAAMAAVAATVAASVVFVAGLWTPVLDGSAPSLRPWTYTPQASRDEIQALSYVRWHVRPGEVVVCEPDRTDVCGELAGLPQLRVSGITNQVYSQKDRRVVERLYVDQEHDFREYLDANVRWAVMRVAGSNWDYLISKAGLRNAVVEVIPFGEWRVVRFTPDNAFTKAPFPATGN